MHQKDCGKVQLGSDAVLASRIRVEEVLDILHPVVHDLHVGIRFRGTDLTADLLHVEDNIDIQAASAEVTRTVVPSGRTCR